MTTSVKPTLYQYSVLASLADGAVIKSYSRGRYYMGGYPLPTGTVQVLKREGWIEPFGAVWGISLAGMRAITKGAESA